MLFCFQTLITSRLLTFCLTVEFDEEPHQGPPQQPPKMASSEVVVDSGVDSEATTPSSPEDQESQEEEVTNAKAQQEDEDMVLETAETLLALSGKSKMPKEFMNRTDTAVVFPQQPLDDDQGRWKSLIRFLKSSSV